MRTRKSARVVLMNDRDEIFMFRHSGRTRTYWVLPGGGLEPGESWEEAALREMWEETGIDGIPLGPWIWSRKGLNHAGGSPWRSEERYFLVRCGSREVSVANQLPHEQQYYTRGRWWSVAAMRQTTEVLYPDRLAKLIAAMIAGEPVTSPIDLPE